MFDNIDFVFVVVDAADGFGVVASSLTALFDAVLFDCLPDMISKPIISISRGQNTDLKVMLWWVAWSSLEESESGGIVLPRVCM